MATGLWDPAVVAEMNGGGGLSLAGASSDSARCRAADASIDAGAERHEDDCIQHKLPPGSRGAEGPCGLSPPVPGEDGEVQRRPSSGSDDELTERASRKSSFIRALSQEGGEPTKMGYRLKVRQFLTLQPVEWFFGSVILANFFVIVFETDWRAASDSGVPKVSTILNHVFFVIYFFELGARIYAFRFDALKSLWVSLDIAIVLAGVAEVIVQLMGETLTATGTIRALRLMRLLRLMRAVRVLGALKELRKLLEMMTSCMKTLFWSFLLCFMVMSIWSIIAVELLSDIVQSMREEGYWSDCEECKRYFSSVMHCNLFFFQTIIAGDSWGKISVPVTERHPWAGIIFCGALLTIIFGVLNLVVAVVVDTFADLRSKDLSYMAMEMELEELYEKKELWKLFEQIDKDKSGEITYEELEDAAGRVPAFRQRLRVLDIDRADLRQLFFLIDRDGSGEIDPEEFIETLYRVKNTESKTATKIIKHYLMHMLPLIQREQSRVQERIVEDLRETKSIMAERMSEIKEMRERLPGIEFRQQGVEENLSAFITESSIGDIKRQIAQHEDTIKQELISIGRHVVSALEKPAPPPSSLAAGTSEFLRARPCSSARSDHSGSHRHDAAGSNSHCSNPGDAAAGPRHDQCRRLQAVPSTVGRAAVPPLPLMEDCPPRRPARVKMRHDVASRLKLRVGPARPPSFDLKQDTATGLPAAGTLTVRKLAGACGEGEGEQPRQAGANGSGGAPPDEALDSPVDSSNPVLEAHDDRRGDSAWKQTRVDADLFDDTDLLSESFPGC